MDIQELKNLVSQYESSPVCREFFKQCKDGERYYGNSNDIKRRPSKVGRDNPLKTADNRVSHSWHGLLTIQKVNYLFGKDPAIDVKDKVLNKKIKDTLGDEWHKTLLDLATTAANKSLSWLHLWIEEDMLQYGLVPTEEIIPIFSKDLKKRLEGVIRRFVSFDARGNSCVKYQYWDKEQCWQYICYGNNSLYIEDMTIKIETEGKVEQYTNRFTHPFGRVPFIYFFNNSIGKNDLYMYRDLIDLFDNTISGFANDFDDIQEILFVLEGYGGEDLEEFLTDLKTFKAVKTDEKGDVRTIRAEIPVEARKEFLKELKESIFLFGMGVNPNPEKFGDSSGVALKFLYSLLELKASVTRTEFDCSIKVLVRVILWFLQVKDADSRDIGVTYYKNMITNDKEVTEILSKSNGIISNKTMTKNHPYVEDLDEELEQIKAEAVEQEDTDYSDSFGSKVSDDNE